MKFPTEITRRVNGGWCAVAAITTGRPVLADDGLAVNVPVSGFGAVRRSKFLAIRAANRAARRHLKEQP